MIRKWMIQYAFISNMWVGRTFVCSVLMLLFLPAGVLAEKKAAGGGECPIMKDGRNRGPHHGQPKMNRNFKTLDDDGDGFLSFEEFVKSKRLSRMDQAKRRKLFDYLDKNKDGKISMKELRPSPPHWMMALRKNFHRLDEDQTGYLDHAQFLKSPKIANMDEKQQNKIFKHLDRNNDQRIQFSELTMKRHRGQPMINFKKYDIDKSGGLSFEEYIKMPWVSRMPETRRLRFFKKLDLDKDGEISPQDVSQVWGARWKCDPSHHGRPNHGKSLHQKPFGGPCRNSEGGGKSENTQSYPFKM